MRHIEGLIPGDNLEKHKIEVIRLIERIHSRIKEVNVADCLGGVYLGKLQFFGGFNKGDLESLLITEINNDILNVIGFAGTHYKEWAPYLQGEIRDWARSLGVKEIHLKGRRGWKKVFRGFTLLKDEDSIHMKVGI